LGAIERSSRPPVRPGLGSLLATQTDATLMDRVVRDGAPDILILKAGARLPMKPIDRSTPRDRDDESAHFPAASSAPAQRGHSLEEVAAITGASEVASKSVFQRGRSHLREFTPKESSDVSLPRLSEGMRYRLIQYVEGFRTGGLDTVRSYASKEGLKSGITTLTMPPASSGLSGQALRWTGRNAGVRQQGLDGALCWISNGSRDLNR
jgi:hypothetical protein